MSCQDFETIIVEIARDRLMDAVARARGLAHAETCAHCSELLAEEQALSVSLRAFSAAAKEEVISGKVETTLLSVFRQQVAEPVSAPVIKPRAAAPARKRLWLLAAAAALLLSFGLSLANWLAVSSEPDTVLIALPTPEHEAHAPVPKPPVPPEQVRPVEQPTRFKPEFRLVRRQKHLLQTPASELLAEEQPRESVTEFFPINQGSELIPLESGQIVRVSMPRSNLIPLGIPFNQERAHETIKADVLVSNDGLARAIRLVY